MFFSMYNSIKKLYNTIIFFVFYLDFSENILYNKFKKLQEANLMLKKVDISEFNTTDITFSNINCLKQSWHDNETYSHLDNPRAESALVLTVHCNIYYNFSDGEYIELPRNSVFFLPQNSRYFLKTTLPEQLPHSCITINFDIHDSNFFPITLKKPHIFMYKNATDDIKKQFLNLADSYLNSTNNTLSLKSQLYQIVHTLIQSSESNSFTPDRNNSVYAAINYIENNLNEQISVSELAKLCTTSEATLRRHFKNEVGMSPIEYMNTLKIKKAQQLLKLPEFTVSTLCEQLNFYDTSYFYKLFKRHTNMTPIQYRKQFLNENKIST